MPYKDTDRAVLELTDNRKAYKSDPGRQANPVGNPFDAFARRIETWFFGGTLQYDITPAKTMLAAMLTNIIGLHRIYAGNYIDAIIYWIMLLCSYGCFFPIAVTAYVVEHPSH